MPKKTPLIEEVVEEEPIINDEGEVASRNNIVQETQIVSVTNQPKPHEDKEQDKLQDIKNWTMQSPLWKLLNVLFEKLTDK